MDEFEKFLEQKIADAEHFLKNGDSETVAVFEIAWELHQECLRQILLKYRSLKKK